MGTEKGTNCDSISRLEVRPIGLKAANRFIEANHRIVKKENEEEFVQESLFDYIQK